MKRIIFASILAATALSGCTQPGENETPDPNQPVAVRFGQSISATVKSVYTDNMLKSTSFSVSALEYTTPDKTDKAWLADNKNFMDMVSVTADASGVLTYTGTKYYSNEAGKEYEFYACYPDNNQDGISISAATAGKAPQVAFDCKANQPDLMWAAPVVGTKASSAINFEFKHMLSLLVVEIKAAAGYTPKPDAVVNAASITAKFDGTMDLATGAITDKSAAGDVTIPIKGNSVTVGSTATPICDALLLPAQENIAGMKITIGSDQKTVTFDSPVKLVANHTTTITLTVDGTKVSFSQSVTGWGQGDSESDQTGSGNVPL